MGWMGWMRLFGLFCLAWSVDTYPSSSQTLVHTSLLSTPLASLVEQPVIAGVAPPPIPIVNANQRATEYENKCDQHWANEILKSGSIKGKKVFIAGLVHNNAAILPKYIKEILRLANSLDSKTTFVSLHESGSSDETPALLAKLKEGLDVLGIENQITTDKTETRRQFEETHEIWQHTSRIAFLAYLRNEVLMPLTTLQRNFDKVLFLNDVLFCAEDAALLLDSDSAHMVAGLDVYNDQVTGMKEKIRIYDTWVFRGIEGEGIVNLKPLRSDHTHIAGEPPFFESTQSRGYLASGQHVPVQCNWGGMVAINAKIFQVQYIRFRSNVVGECPASECSLFCNDIWRIYGEETRILLDPRVFVAYDYTAWNTAWELRANRFTCDGASSCLNWQEYLNKPRMYSNTSMVFTDVHVPDKIECYPIVNTDGADFYAAHDDTSWNMPLWEEKNEFMMCPEITTVSSASSTSEIATAFETDKQVDKKLFQLPVVELAQTEATTAPLSKINGIDKLFQQQQLVQLAINVPANSFDLRRFAQVILDLTHRHELKSQFLAMTVTILLDGNVNTQDGSLAMSIARNILLAIDGSGGIVGSLNDPSQSSLRGKLYHHLALNPIEKFHSASHGDTVILVMANWPFCGKDIYDTLSFAGNTQTTSSIILHSGNEVVKGLEIRPEYGEKPVVTMVRLPHSQTIKSGQLDEWLDRVLPQEQHSLFASLQ